jgi:uncharacterized membrane protein YdjX (TVP38/TMEM64 family)
MPKSHISLAAAILLLLAGAAALWWLAPAGALGLDESVEVMVGLIRSWGAWGVAGSIALMVAHSFLPFPAEILACANGLIYGPLWGSVITWVGAMLGAAAAFGLARRLGRPFVYRMLRTDQRERLAAWSGEHGGAALLVARLIPVIAFNLINYAAALTEISWWTFLWATGVGILPLTILLAIFGDRMLGVPVWMWLLLAAAAAFAWLLARRWRKL